MLSSRVYNHPWGNDKYVGAKIHTHIKYKYAYLARPQGKVGGAEVPVDEAVGDGALEVGVQAVHAGPEAVPHS